MPVNVVLSLHGVPKLALSYLRGVSLRCSFTVPRVLSDGTANQQCEGFADWRQGNIPAPDASQSPQGAQP